MKTLFTLIFALLISVSSYAQKPDKEKVKALKVAYITEQLDLSEKEAQVFWPIYNANEEANNNLRENSGFKHIKNIDAISEAEAKVYLDKIEQIELSKRALQIEYSSKLKTVLSSKKTLKLMNVERSFRHKMIKEWKERHRQGKQKRE